MESIQTTTAEAAKVTAEKTRVRLSTTPEERATYVALFEDSGKTAAEFCKEMGLAESTLALWRRQARGSSSGEAVTFTEVPQSLVEAALRVPGSATATAMVHFPNGLRVEVTSAADVNWVARLAAALRS